MKFPAESKRPTFPRTMDGEESTGFVCGHGGLVRRRCPYRTGVPMPYNSVHPEPKGSLSHTTSVIPYPCGPTCPRYHYPTRTDHCRDWVICVPRYRVSRSLGSGSITPSVAYRAYRGDPLGRIDLYRRLPVANPSVGRPSTGANPR